MKKCVCIVNKYMHTVYAIIRFMVKARVRDIWKIWGKKIKKAKVK